MHLWAHHVGGISTINPDTQTNLTVAGHTTTSPNINHHQDQKLNGMEKRKYAIAKGMNAQANRNKCRICKSTESHTSENV